MAQCSISCGSSRAGALRQLSERPTINFVGEIG